jgi:hypothetical protein
MNIIVFSKNRALQLELFLRSMKKYFVEFNDYKVQILYTATDQDYEAGYTKLKKMYPRVTFVNEVNFKADLIKLIDCKKLLTVFFVDDMVFKESFSMKSKNIQTFKNSNDVICFSLRLHPRLTNSYATSSIMHRPVIIDYAYGWGGASGDYGYPMSVDGHIFKTMDIYDRIVKGDYSKPNSFEGCLTHLNISKPKMMCFDKSIVFNNPLNRVQTEIINKSSDTPVSYLNGMFLEGYIIDLEPFDNFENKSVHQVEDIRLIKEV